VTPSLDRRVDRIRTLTIYAGGGIGRRYPYYVGKGTGSKAVEGRFEIHPSKVQILSQQMPAT
jgi:hypothetical protein